MRKIKFLAIAALSASMVTTWSLSARAGDNPAPSDPPAAVGGAPDTGGQHPGATRQGHGFLDLLTQLDLSREQQEKIKPIIDRSIKKTQELLRDPNSDEDALPTQMRAIQQDMQQKIMALLTDEQKARLQALAQKQRQNPGPPPGENKGENGGGENGGGEDDANGGARQEDSGGAPDANNGGNHGDDNGDDDNDRHRVEA